jgi:hypothetical protein
MWRIYKGKGYVKLVAGFITKGMPIRVVSEFTRYNISERCLFARFIDKTLSDYDNDPALHYECSLLHHSQAHII